MSETPNRLEVLAGELETLRSEITELDALEAPSADAPEAERTAYTEKVARYDAALDEWDTKKTEHDNLAARAARSEKVRAAQIASPSNSERGVNVITRKDPFEGVENLRYMPEGDVRSRALEVFGDDAKFRGLSDKQHDALVARIENIPGAAMHTLVHGSPAYRSAFDAFMLAGKNGSAPLYSQAEAEAVRASLALGGSTGGYVLPTLLDPTLIHTGTATKNPLRSIARVIEGTQNVWHGVSVGNVTTAWTAEATAMSDGSPTLSNPSVTAAKLTAYVTGSYEIFEDSDLQMQLPGLIGESFGYAESTAFVVGSGSNAPKGIVTAISATAASTVTATTRGAFTSASAVDVFALVQSLPSRYEDSATWVANKATFNTIRQMSTGSQGSYFWTNFNNDVVPGAQPLLGSPVVQASDMASATTSGTVLIVLGDWSQFVIYDRLGTSVEFVQNVFNSSALPLGQRGLIAHKRVGSDCTDINAFRFLKA